MWKWGLGVLILVAGCGSDEVSQGSNGGSDASTDVATEAGACSPGVQIACACIGGAEGAQRCKDDGSGWGECLCPDASPDAPSDATEDADDAPVDAVEESVEDAGADATCGDLLTDPNHCGRCDHSCLGGDCFDGMCQPFKLATIIDGARGLAVDATQVYAAIQLNNVVVRIDKKSGAILSSLSEPDVIQPSWVAVDSTSFYWTNRMNTTGSIAKCPIAGCGMSQPTVVVASADRPNGIVADGTNIYWAETNGGTIKKAAPDGSNVVTLVAASENWKPFQLALQGGYLYFSEVAEGRVARVPIAGGTVETMAISSSPGGVAVTDSRVYWAVGAVGGGIYRVPNTVPPANGHTPELVAGGQDTSSSVAVDDENIYWLASASWIEAEGALRMCPIAGCPSGGPIDLANGIAYPIDLALDDAAIYYTVYGIDGVVDGAVMKIAKP
jgi:hypothetical protein